MSVSSSPAGLRVGVSSMSCSVFCEPAGKSLHSRVTWHVSIRLRVRVGPRAEQAERLGLGETRREGKRAGEREGAREKERGSHQALSCRFPAQLHLQSHISLLFLSPTFPQSVKAGAVVPRPSAKVLCYLQVVDIQSKQSPFSLCSLHCWTRNAPTTQPGSAPRFQNLTLAQHNRVSGLLP
eukprot:1533908-Rhodomonas_salina.1